MLTIPRPNLKPFGLISGFAFILCSCASNNNPVQPPQTDSNPPGGKGDLSLVANGEDFVRQGFETKDGWKIDFDKVYVTLAQVQAYQTDPPYDPHSGAAIKAKETVTLLEGTKTVDLAAGAADATPILVATVPAPAGGYNALSWKLVRSNEAATKAHSILLQGKATKENQTINFTIGLNQELDYLCGEFVGDERKGWLKNAETAELETTFHFDHLFGDRQTPADDTLNKDALGFDPLAKLAANGQLVVDGSSLAQKLSPSDYSKLEKAIAGLGHVGEGHCELQGK